MDEHNIKVEDYYVNLNQIYKFIIRNIKYLSFFSLIGLIITSFTFINMKRTWFGSFQIVIEKDQNSITNTAGSSAAELYVNQISNAPSSYKTEVEILKSPFVLLNIFEFIKDFDLNYKSKDISFKDWSDNVDVNLTKGTSVLNITYKDFNKLNIIPVLEKISQKYQNYSNSQRKRNIELSLDYFKNQIDIYKKRSILSKKNSDDFATKHDLLYLRKNNQVPSAAIGSNPVLTIESIRTKEANKIKKINALIERIKLDKNKPNSIVHLSQIIGKTIDPTGTSLINTKSSIDTLNLNIISAKEKYNQNDLYIKKLEIKKRNNLDYLYQETLGILEAAKKNSIAKLKSSQRPLGVISKYKELIRKSIKDEIMLSNLEDQLRTYSLENAKSKDPWKLITNPTLNPRPYPTYKLRKLILGLLASLITGSLILYIREQKENKIYTEFGIERVFKGISIYTFKRSEKQRWDELIKLICIGFLGFEVNIKMLLIDFEEDDEIRFLTNLFNSNLKKSKILNTSSIDEAFNEKEFLLCIKSSISSKNKLELIYQNIVNQNKKIKKIIFIDN